MKLSAIRAALAELDLTPSKTLGQNFLHDQNLARWIVDQLDVSPGDQLLEIGPGLGALTGVALEKNVPLLALEKDQRLAAFLARRFAGVPHLRVQPGDALEFDVRALWPQRPVKVFGNLPYYVSTPLLFHFTSPAAPVERAVFLLQRELAERIAAAAPGTKDYGILSVILGRRWRVRLLRVLPPTAFLPEPKVDSALISLTRRAPEELPACDEQTFDRLVRLGFSQRRKQLGSLLRPFLLETGAPTWDALAGLLGIKPTARGEELDLRTWIALANAVCPVQPTLAQDVQREIFDVVNAQDEVVGAAPRGIVHAEGFWHRAIHIFVFNAAGEVFLQKRSVWKDKCPGLWDSSAAGHLDQGENYAAAAARELREELGIASPVPAASLQWVAKLPATPDTGWEFVGLFQVTHEGPFRWPAAEIETGSFFPVSVVHAWTVAHPEDFAPGFLRCWELYTRQGAPPGTVTNTA